MLLMFYVVGQNKVQVWKKLISLTLNILSYNHGDIVIVVTLNNKCIAHVCSLSGLEESETENFC